MARLSGPVKAAVFDIGATLITGPPVAPNKVIAGLVRGVTAAEVASVIMTMPLESAEHARAVLERRFGKLDDAAAAGLTELWSAQSSAAVEIEGATEAVLSLKRASLKIGLLSDIWSPYYASVEKAIPRVIEAADAIVLSCRTGARKPSPDNFLAVLSELGAAPGEAVMIGDTYAHDILPAIELGMQTVWVLARPDREAESIVKVLNGELPTPTATVSSIVEVISFNIQHSTLNTQERSQWT